MTAHFTTPGNPAMDNRSDASAKVEELAEEFLDRRRHGDRPSVTEYTQKYPDLADQIRAFFPALALVEELKPSPDDRTGSFGGSGFFARGTTLQRLGDYRILREVGRGGMGVVYEAEQESLGRRVALKVLASASLLDPTHLARFHREAKAAARLHHTNIVPVFGVGESNGVHYYVMQFIPGRGLDAVIDEMKRELKSRKISQLSPPPVGHRLSMEDKARLSGLSGPSNEREHAFTFESESLAMPGQPDVSAEESIAGTSVPASGHSVLATRSNPASRFALGVARIGAQVAEALGHAHAQGTLHRDIKPSNILLDAHGNCWVTDFGLAKADADDDLTHTGDIVGTIRYMAPERFQGLCDARSDIYSLGLTLYEVLARRPAFDETSRNTLIRQVTQSEPPRLRRLDPSIPRDIETIIHKAIEKDPAHRYATAGELAEDLRRFLEDRPIRARRVSAIEKLARWGRHNPWIARSLAFAFLALFTGVFVSFVMYRRAERKAADAEAANTSLLAAQEQLERTLYASHMNLAQAAWDSSDTGRVQRLLNQERPQAGAKDLRGWEWYYWQRLAHNELHALRGHHDRVIAVAYSPDGHTIASAGDDGSVRFWDAATGSALREFELGKAQAHEIAFHPDGRMVAIGGGDRREPGRLEIRDLSTGAVVWSDHDGAGPLHCLAYSADGRSLAVDGFNGSVIIYDSHSGTVTQRLRTHGAPVSSLAFSPDGHALALAHLDGLVTVCNIASGKVEVRISGHTGPVHGLAYHPGGAMLATCGLDRTVRLWDARTGALVRDLTRHMGPVRKVRFSPDGTLVASAGADQTIRLTEVATGHETASLHGHADMIHDLAFSPDGSTFASASFDGTVRIWDPRTPPLGQTGFAIETSGMIDALAVSPDGTRVALSAGAPHKGTRVEIWQAVPARRIAALEGHTDIVSNVSFSPDGAHVSTSSRDRTVRLWDAKTGREVRRWTFDESIRGMALSRDGQRIALAMDHPRNRQGVRVLDVATGADVGLLRSQRIEAIAIAFSPDGHRLAIGGVRGNVQIWDASTGSLVRDCKGHDGPVESVAFSSDGKRIVSGGMDRQVRIWDAATGALLFRYEGHSSGVSRVAFSPDGKRIASAGRNAVKLWDAHGGGELLSLKDQNRLAFSADGWKLVTAGDDRSIHIWDATSRGPDDPEELSYFEHRRFNGGPGRPPRDLPPPPPPDDVRKEPPEGALRP